MNDTCNVATLLQQIRSKSTRPPESHFIETLGMTLHFRHLTGLESDELQLSTIDDATGKVVYGKLKGHRAKVVASCLVDANGDSVVTAEEVNRWDNDVITEMHGVCQKINKLGKEEVAEEVKD